MSRSSSNVARGEIWLVDFNPTIGKEIQKTRPALVVSADAIGGPGMKIVVPFTTYRDKHDRFPWCVSVKPNQRNGLDNKSTADTFQIKSVSMERFVRRIGVVSSATLDDVVAAVAICIEL